MIAEVILNENAKDLDRIFDYNVPNDLVQKAKMGSRVIVPFGNRKTIQEGFIIGFKEKSEYKLKDILKLEENPFLDEKKIKFAKWIGTRYFANLSECLKLMLPPGTRAKNIENRVKEKTENFVYLKKQKEEIQDDIINKKIKSEKQRRILEFLLKNDEVLISDLEAFTDTSRAIIKTLEKNNYIQICEKQVERNPLIHKMLEKSQKLEFTKEQEESYKKIETAINSNKDIEFLLFGVTGSGKTEIYLQAIEKVIKTGKTSIMLVPEISLTPQMVDRFVSRFGQEKIAVIHSKLSIGERYDAWNRIAKNEVNIVIGARSAIFAPIKNVGIVIIDEEHDTSYQSEGSPRYDAKDIARYIAKENSCPLVLGSATPSLESYKKAKEGKIELLELKKRANNSLLPNIEIVDLREELANGNRSMISEKLKEEIQKNIENKEQTILFLNRRGYSTFVMCRDCGYTIKCKNCNITMTYHLKEDKLKCHYCGHEEKRVNLCPECGSINIRYFGTGTQKLEQEINKIFPNVSTIRMDIDTVSKKNSHEEILNKFKNENINILIGTQMVVKGHHFPNVTLVGVIAADSSLNIEDFRANERTFQILTQVAGRAGREKKEGRVLIQTYNPDSLAIEYAKMQDYKSFYESEIQIRKQLKYPPFCDIIVFEFSGENEQNTINQAKKIHKYLKEKIINERIGVILYSPVPAPINKIKNKYRYRMIIKCLYNNEINKLLQETIQNNELKKDVRQIIQINPNNMM